MINLIHAWYDGTCLIKILSYTIPLPLFPNMNSRLRSQDYNFYVKALFQIPNSSLYSHTTIGSYCKYGERYVKEILHHHPLSHAHHQYSHTRAYPGSEFVVANTLAKWKKLEPNEINFSQGFSHQQVVLYLTLYLLCLLITFANSFDPDQA